MSGVRRLLCVVGIGVAGLMPLHGVSGQHRPIENPFSAFETERSSPVSVEVGSVEVEADGGSTLLGASIGGVAGIAAGALAGAVIGNVFFPDRESAEVFGVVAGGIVGSTIGTALGAHLTAAPGDSLARRLLVSTGIAAGVVGATLLAPDYSVVIVSIPLLQVLPEAL